MLLATPLYSNTTLMPLLATLFHGGHVVLMPKFDAEDYLDLAEAVRQPPHTMLVPVQYQRVSRSGVLETSQSRGSFLVKQCTSAPLAKSAKQKRSYSQWPGQFLEVYGLTEGGCTCILDATRFPRQDRPRSAGRPRATISASSMRTGPRELAGGSRRGHRPIGEP